MRTALVLLSVLLFQAVGAGAVLHGGLASGTTGATAPHQPGQAGESGVGPAPTLTRDDPPIERIAFLTLGESSRERLTTQSINATAAVSVGRDDVAARLEEYAFEERLNRTGDPEAVVATELDALEDEVGALARSRATLGRRYANGSIDTAGFLRGTVVLQARALRLRVRVAGIRDVVEGRGDGRLLARVEGLENELLGLGGPRGERALAGPVRERALAALRGTGHPLDLYVAGSERGFVFAAIGGTEYVREAYRADHYSSEGTAFGLTEAAQRARELYPVAFDLNVSLGYGISGLGSGRYLIRSDYPFGSLSSYLDGTTRNVFFEIQHRDLSRTSRPASIVARENGTRLTVNRSYPGGPLRVAVVDNATGRPIETTVHVGETRHRTGSDGIVWALTPPSAVFTVRAVGPSGNVTINARPLVRTTINGSS